MYFVILGTAMQVESIIPAPTTPSKETSTSQLTASSEKLILSYVYSIKWWCPRNNTQAPEPKPKPKATPTSSTNPHHPTHLCSCRKFSPSKTPRTLLVLAAARRPSVSSAVQSSNSSAGISTEPIPERLLVPRTRVQPPAVLSL